jgi:hypothetical protein
MSNVDSFIEEVTEEVRRDRLYGYLKRYGWIAALVIVTIVGGAAWREYSKSRDAAAAQALGDAMLAALAENESAARAKVLAGVEASTPGSAAVLALMRGAAEASSGQVEDAVAGLNRVAGDNDVPQIYRQIASFKALLLQTDTLSADDRRAGFRKLTSPGQPLRLLAEEQLALIDVAEGNTDAALERLQALLQDAEADARLQQRASQMIVALGGKPQARPGSTG